MYKACSRCGRIHASGYRCAAGKIYQGGEERKLRNLHVWHKKAEEIKEKAGYLCEVCKAEGIYKYSDLEVHHITKLRDNKEGLLDNNNLVCLCVEHHKKADKGKIDVGYLRELSKKREDSR